MSSPNLLQLPPEVVIMILTSLSLLDRGCFAMSCQYVFGCLLSSLESQELKLSQLFPREKRPQICPNVEEKPRVQFLRRIENERWKYCCDCWILHPQFQIKLDDKTYCFDCQKLHNRYCFGSGICMPYAGQVEICPCLTITFRDMLQLIKEASSPNQERLDQNSVFQRRDYSCLEHSCVVKHPVMDAQVTTTLRGNESNFEVMSCFQFTVATDHSSEGVTPSSFCPHKDPSAWLRRFFDEAGSNFSGWPSAQALSPIKVEQQYSYLPHTFGMTFKRNLGSSKWPNENWNRHRCN